MKIAAQAAPTAAQPDVLKAMMLLEAAKQRAVIANKASLEAELEKDAAEQAVEILKSKHRMAQAARNSSRCSAARRFNTRAHSSMMDRAL